MKKFLSLMFLFILILCGVVFAGEDSYRECISGCTSTRSQCIYSCKRENKNDAIGLMACELVCDSIYQDCKQDCWKYKDY